MGAIYDDLDNHEGYGTRIGRYGEPADPDAFTAYQAACACGWRGQGRHAPTPDGYEHAVHEWDTAHAQPLLQHAVPRDLADRIDAAKVALRDLARTRPAAARLALDELATWATTMVAATPPPTPTPPTNSRPRARHR